MCELTFVARALDGLILTETWDGQREGSLQSFKTQAKQLLKNLQSAPHLGSIDSGNMCFHYQQADGVIFMTLCNRAYPKKLAFAFLEDVVKAFQDELRREFGTHMGVDYRSKIDTIEKPYYFIKFDRVIQRHRNELRDPDSQKALQRVNESLLEVNSIVKQSIDQIINRGEKLEDVSAKAGSLLDASKSFAKGAKHLNWQLLVEKYKALAAIVAFILLVLLVKFRGCL